ELDYPTADHHLDRAAANLDEDQSVDGLFVHKWKSVLSAFRSGDRKPIEDFKALALKFGHWESVRDADFQLLKMMKDESLFKKLYFGTIYEHYKVRLDNLGIFKVHPKQNYELGEGDRLFDLAKGEVDGSHSINPGKKIHHFIS